MRAAWSGGQCGMRLSGHKPHGEGGPYPTRHHTALENEPPAAVQPVGWWQGDFLGWICLGPWQQGLCSLPRPHFVAHSFPYWKQCVA